MKKLALISVFDKEGVIDFAKKTAKVEVGNCSFLQILTVSYDLYH